MLVKAVETIWWEQCVDPKRQADSEELALQEACFIKKKKKRKEKKTPISGERG